MQALRLFFPLLPGVLSCLLCWAAGVYAIASKDDKGSTRLAYKLDLPQVRPAL